MTSRLVKIEGAGNDFVLGFDRWARRLADDPELVRRLCDRRFGIGADGALAVTVADAERVLLTHRNADGSPSDFCGNGTRCAARAAVELGHCHPDLVVVTGWGAIPAVVRGAAVSLELPGIANPPGSILVPIGDRQIQAWLLTVGVPHLVVPIPDPAVLDLASVAPQLRRHPELGSDGANVNFIAAGVDQPVAIRSWERGVEGETLACGSGIVAAALVLMAERRLTSLALRPASGDVLKVEALGEPPMCKVRLTGPTRIIGEFEPSQELLDG